MKTITIKLRTILFATLTLLALVCFAPAGHAKQITNPDYPAANGLAQTAKQDQTATTAASKPGKEKTKKTKAEKRALRMTQGSGCMDFLFIGWGH
jgi:hypothetical protein